MNATALKFENNLLDLVTAIVMAPVAALYGLAWLIWQGAVLLGPYRKHIGLALAIAGGAWLFVATMPRSPRGGWGLACGVSRNSKAVSYANS